MKILLAVGTRPEAIKMAGIVYELKKRSGLDWLLCSTGQHRTMLDDVMQDLEISADVDLDVMSHAQGLTNIMSTISSRIEKIITDYRPDWVLVQGDTTTAYAAALVAFYNKIPVGHVEAGLRTYDRYSPWPEEVHRKLISAIATCHFAPTCGSQQNLIAEGIPADDTLMTGNTVIDALLQTVANNNSNPSKIEEMKAAFGYLRSNRKMILVTGHRRENFGENLNQICQALLELADRDDVEIVFPVHLNPCVRTPVEKLLSRKENIHLIEPQRYSKFVHLMEKSTIILTDSGGIQEEAPSLGKPVLVLRNTTERPEAVEAGTSRLVRLQKEAIVSEASKLLDDSLFYNQMSRKENPYGDGKASYKIVEHLIAQHGS